MGFVGGIPSAVAAAVAGAAARGDNRAGGSLLDKDYYHCLQAIADNLSGMTIGWYLWQQG